MRQPPRIVTLTAARPATGWRERAVTIGLYLGIWVVGVLVFTAPGATQAHFRVTFAVKSRDARTILLDGRVFNDTGADVLDVWVTAEALSKSGKVLGRGIAFVGSSISRADSASCEAKVPAAEGVETFRVSVTSYRAGREVQSP